MCRAVAKTGKCQRRAPIQLVSPCLLSFLCLLSCPASCLLVHIAVQMAGRKRSSTAGRSLRERMKAAVTDNPWDRAIIKATDSSRALPKAKHVKGLVKHTIQKTTPLLAHSVTHPPTHPHTHTHTPTHTHTHTVNELEAYILEQQGALPPLP